MNLNLLKITLFLTISIWLNKGINAQPENDGCGSAIEIIVGADRASAIKVSGTTVGAEDAREIEGPAVCSASWYADDVWYYFVFGEELPEIAVRVEGFFGSNDTDLKSMGMAYYTSCEKDAPYYYCENFSPQATYLDIPSACFSSGDMIILRVWSGESPNSNSGTFEISAFNIEESTGNNELNTVLYHEDFNDGMEDWEILALSDGDEDSTEVWKWKEDGFFSTYNGGSFFTNQIGAVCTGAVGFEAGVYQVERGIPSAPPYPKLHSELISPAYDCTDPNFVGCEFVSALTGLNGVATDEYISNLGMLFSYSIDNGVTWEPYKDFTRDLIFNTFYDQKFYIPMKKAAGHDQVKVKFIFHGDFYQWVIDDIKIVIPPDYNLRTNPFFGVASNAITPSIPAAQPVYIDFLADIENLGGLIQSGINLNGKVFKNEEEVFSTDLEYNDIDTDSTAENQIFANPFVTTDEGDYIGEYYVSSENEDADPSDNQKSFEFHVGGNTYSKTLDNSINSSIRPNSSWWPNSTDPQSYAWGNIYYIENEGNLQCNSITYQLSNLEAVNGETVTFKLYKWDGQFELDNRRFVLDSDNLELVGFTSIDIDENTSTDETLIELIPLDDSNPAIILQGGNHYVVMMEFLTDSNESTINLPASNTIDYSAFVFANTPDFEETPEIIEGLGANHPEYFPMYMATFLAEGEEFDNTTYVINRNGADEMAVLKLHLINTVGTENVFADNAVLKLFPNPTNESVTLEFDLNQNSKDIQLEIVDITGKSIFTKNIGDKIEGKIKLNTKDLKAGNYIVKLFSKNGIIQKKLTIVH